jgi:hypothetical protein
MTNQFAKKPTGPVLQRKCGCGGQCPKCGDDKRKLQRSAHTDVAAGSLAPPIVHDVLRSGGEPLDRATRAHYESRMGHDFSNVRVHRDAQAAASAQAVDALAYTVGSHVVLGRNAAPSTLAHELVHTVQQQSMPAGGELRVGPAGDHFEQQADRVAQSVMKDPQ